MPMNDEQFTLGQLISRYCDQHPYAGSRTRPEPGDITMERVGEDKIRLRLPLPERMYAPMQLLDSPLIEGITWEDDALHIRDSYGQHVAYRPLFAEPYGLVICFERIED